MPHTVGRARAERTSSRELRSEIVNWHRFGTGVDQDPSQTQRRRAQPLPPIVILCICPHPAPIDEDAPPSSQIVTYTMVGVPGRSRACQVCRERRVTCDLIRPICSQCARKNRPCTYERNHIFVNNDDGTHKTMYRKADGWLAGSCPPNHKPINNSTSSKSESLESSDDLNPEDSDEFPTLQQAVRRWKTPSLCESLQQALVATAIGEGKYSKEYSLFGLLSRSLELDAPGDLYTAPLACYAVWRGRKDGNPNLINASHRFYIQALRATERALRSPIKAREDVTLAACNALGLFEALECPNRTVTGFRWHRDACCRLIELRGPEAHQTGLGHVLFISMRTFGVGIISPAVILCQADEAMKVLGRSGTCRTDLLESPRMDDHTMGYAAKDFQRQTCRYALAWTKPSPKGL